MSEEGRRRRIRRGDVVRSEPEGVGKARYEASYWQGSYGDWWVDFDDGYGAWKFRRDLVLIERGGQPISDRLNGSVRPNQPGGKSDEPAEGAADA